jgi:hypothetical protein
MGNVRSSKCGTQISFDEMDPDEPDAFDDEKVAYVRPVTYREAEVLYPEAGSLPKDVELYSLHAADGSPLCLTNSREAAIGHAIGEELDIARVH